MRQVEQRIGVDRSVPYSPQRVVLGAQPPQREGLDAQRSRRAHLVQHRHRVQEPHLVTDVRIVVVVGEVDVERVGIELDLRFRIVRVLPCLLGRLLLHRQDLGSRLLACVLLRRSGRQRHRPVVPIAAQGADHLVLGTVFSTPSGCRGTSPARRSVPGRCRSGAGRSS